MGTKIIVPETILTNVINFITEAILKENGFSSQKLKIVSFTTNTIKQTYVKAFKKFKNPHGIFRC